MQFLGFSIELMEIKLFEAGKELSFKDMDLLRSIAETQASKLSTCKSKIQASDKKMTSLENALCDLKNNYARLIKSPPF
jgi:hypothetical protein